MAKLVLQPDPTFQEKVGIVRPGAEPGEVLFTFKHRTREELVKFLDQVSELDNVQMILAVASGWDLADEFNEANVRVLTENFIPAPRAVFDTYCSALQGARAKN